MFGAGSLMSALLQAQQNRKMILAYKMARVRGAYKVQIKDGQIIIHAKTRVPKVEHTKP